MPKTQLLKATTKQLTFVFYWVSRFFSVLETFITNRNFFEKNCQTENCLNLKTMNGFFDGQFRRTPTVSMGGASKKLTKEELLAKAQKEREQRQVSCQKTTFFPFFDSTYTMPIFFPVNIDNQEAKCQCAEHSI